MTRYSRQGTKNTYPIYPRLAIFHVQKLHYYRSKKKENNKQTKTICNKITSRLVMSDFYNLSQTKLPENRLIEFGNRTRSSSRKKIDHSNAIERSNERDWVLSN